MGLIANDPTHSQVPSIAMAPIRPHDSCNCAMHLIYPLCRWWIARHHGRPEIEKTALVRHAVGLFTCTSLTVPLFAFVLRKGYGLGAQAMTGGGFKASAFTVTWPTGEFGGMGLEGAVKLGYRKELEAIDDTEARKKSTETRCANVRPRRRQATALKSTRSRPQRHPPLIMAGFKSTPKPCLA